MIHIGLTCSCASGDEGTRTPNPCLAKAVLCQLSYAPEMAVNKPSVCRSVGRNRVPSGRHRRSGHTLAVTSQACPVDAADGHQISDAHPPRRLATQVV